MINNNIFPFEILKNIFSYIEDPIIKSRNCQLVCRSWYSAIGIHQEKFTVQLLDVQMNNFIQDLDKYSNLASKVRSIIMLPSNMLNKDITKFQTMINYCHQLEQLHFKSVNTYEYIKGLDSREAKLPKIEKITLDGIERTVPSLKRFHLWINFRFRETIKHLEIFDLEHIGVLKDCDRLVLFTTTFPNLESIHVKFQLGNTERIDLHHLLSKNKQLSKLRLNQINHIIVEHQEQQITYPLVKELDISTITTTSTNLFQYIMNKFSNLNRLFVTVNEPVPHNHLNATENRLILERFINYCNEIDKIKISFRYNDQFIELSKGLDQEDQDPTNEEINEHFIWEHDQLFFREDFEDDIFQRDEYPSPPAFYDDYLDTLSIASTEFSPPPSPDDDYDIQDDLNQNNEFNNMSDPDYFDALSDPNLDDLNDPNTTEYLMRMEEYGISSEDEQDFHDLIMNRPPSEQDYLDMLMNDPPTEPDMDDYMNAFPDDPTEQEYMDMMTIEDHDFLDFMTSPDPDFFDEPDQFSDPSIESLDNNWHQSFDQDIPQYEVYFNST